LHHETVASGQLSEGFVPTLRRMEVGMGPVDHDQWPRSDGPRRIRYVWFEVDVRRLAGVSAIIPAAGTGSQKHDHRHEQRPDALGRATSPAGRRAAIGLREVLLEQDSLEPPEGLGVAAPWLDDLSARSDVSPSISTVHVEAHRFYGRGFPRGETHNDIGAGSRAGRR
jgi:hypothetical protein